jgi:protein translocase SEC61 complex gamma subunit
MGLGTWLTAAWRTLKLTRKSDREEFFLYMKLVLLGFAVVGVLGFVIYYFAAEIELVTGAASSSSAGTNPAILFHFLKSKVI